MKFALVDDPVIQNQLQPFTYTRPIAEIRWGSLTIAEKWEKYLRQKPSYISSGYLESKFASPANWDNLLVINGAIAPNERLVESLATLESGRSIVQNGIFIAAMVSEASDFSTLNNLPSNEFDGEIDYLTRPWHIFKEAGKQIRDDYTLLTKGRSSEPINDRFTAIYSKENIFLEEGVRIKSAVLDADRGPIYLGRNSTIEPGAVIRGPFSLGEGSTVNSNGIMRGDISIGPHCKVGGEVSNSIIFGYSNKGHDGFLGNSVLGEMCNIGAGTITSNLKNNYATVKIWDYTNKKFLDTKEQFCGLMMGDHSKSGIGTMFNTGTIVGVACNIFGSGFPRTFIPSFSWGGAAGFMTHRPNKVKETASIAMARRDLDFNQIEENIINHVFEVTNEYRTWDKEKK